MICIVDMGQKGVSTIGFMLKKKGLRNLFSTLGAQKVKREAGGLWITQLTQDNSFYPGQRNRPRY